MICTNNAQGPISFFSANSAKPLCTPRSRAFYRRKRREMPLGSQRRNKGMQYLVPSSPSVHGSDVVGQRHRKFATAGGDRAAERAAAQDFNGSVIRECEMVIGGTERFGIRLQLLVAADELDGIHLCNFSGSATEQDEEIRVAGLPGFAQIDGAQVVELILVVGNGGVGLGISPC